MFIKIKGSEISIATANDINQATSVRVFNTGAVATVNVAYSNGVVYGNTSISNTESVVIVKGSTDLLTGANMKAAPVEYRG